MDARPGGPTAKRQPSPEGLGLNPGDDPSAVGAALNPAPLAPVSLGAKPRDLRFALMEKRNLEAIRPRHIRFCRKWNRSPPLRYAPVGMTNLRAATHLRIGGGGWTESKKQFGSLWLRVAQDAGPGRESWGS